MPRHFRLNLNRQTDSATFLGLFIPLEFVKPLKARRKCQVSFMLLPLGQVAKAYPHVASRSTGEICPSNLLVLLREVGIITLGVECLCIGPKNLGGLWIDLAPNGFAQGV